jgi:hypothetical protein
MYTLSGASTPSVTVHPDVMAAGAAVAAGPDEAVDGCPVEAGELHADRAMPKTATSDSRVTETPLRYRPGNGA